MAFDINNFVIDRIRRGIMVSTTDGTVMYSINQITNPSLNCTADETTATDALGTTIMTFQRAKNAEFSAENALFDINLLASQMGTTKSVASASSKIVAPMFETIDITSAMVTAGTVQLAKQPTKTITDIYQLKGDSTFGTKYTVSTSASAANFAYDNTTHTISLPTSVTAGQQIFVMYEYESDAAVEVVNSAANFPKAGKFIMEVIGNDVCDPTSVVYAYLIFPNAKLDSNVDLSFATDGTHGFKLKAQQDYCDKQKRLFSLVIPDLD